MAKGHVVRAPNSYSIFQGVVLGSIDTITYMYIYITLTRGVYRSHWTLELTPTVSHIASESLIQVWVLFSGGTTYCVCGQKRWRMD